MTSLPIWCLALCACSFAIHMAVIVSQRWHLKYSGDHHDGVQRLHGHEVTRVGGVGVFVAMCVAVLAIPMPSSMLYCSLLGASLPIFIAGLFEDLFKNVSPKSRFYAALLSAALFCVITGIYVSDLGVSGVDALLAIPALGVLFTVVAVAGMTHSVNLIDGLNGFASGYLLIVSLALSFIGFAVGEQFVAIAGALFASAILGFLLLNWPFGRIFLGDAGSYFCGFMVAFLAVILYVRSGQVSSWVIAALLIYPVTETLFSLLRRKAANKPIMQPDNEHLHSLIKRCLVKKTSGQYSALSLNSAAGAISVLLSVLPIGLAICMVIYPNLSASVLSVFFLSYFGIYFLLRYQLRSPQLVCSEE